MALGITVDFSANIARFSTQIDRISNDLSRFQQRAEATSSRVNKAFSALGAGLSVAAITEFVKQGIDAADALNDMSLKTGIAVEKLAGFQLATKQSGTDMDAFTLAANKLSVNIAKNSEEFAKLGITAKDPAEAFLQLADVFSSIEDPQLRAALGAEILGKNWQALAPLLSEGGAALRATVAEGAKLSGITAEMAKQADIFNDQIEKMHTIVGGVAAKIGGEWAEGFNQLAEKIGIATQSGVTFNNVMMGIGDFAFQNVFDDVERVATLSTEVNAINDKIIKARENLKNAKGDPTIPRDILHKAGDKSGEIAAEQKLNDLLFERDKLIIHLGESRKKPITEVSAPTTKTIQDFIGIGADDAVKKAASKTSSNRKAALTDEQKAAEQLQKSYEGMLASLQKELDLRDKTSEVAQVEYEIINGSLKGLGPLQQQNLLGLAKEKDALELQDKKWAALVESANEYYDLRTNNAELIRSGDIQSGFGDALAKTQDQLKLGTITTDQAKAEFDKLGKAWNDEFIEPAKKGTDQLSQFSIQAARNMQDSFANFLFDPFKGGLNGMLTGFTDIIRKMIAQEAAAQIFSSKKEGGLGLGDLFKTGVSSAFSGAGSFLSGLFHEGGIVGQGGGTIAVSPLVFAGAHRYHTGGIAGLKPDEVPSILQRGELVISRKQLANGGSGVSGGAGQINNVTINVQSQQGESSSVTGQKVGEAFVRAIAQQEIKSAARPGNTLNSTVKFG